MLVRFSISAYGAEWLDIYMNLSSFAVPLNKQSITPSITGKDAAFVWCSS